MRIGSLMCRILLLLVLGSGVIGPTAFADGGPVVIEVLTRSGCPRCAAAKEFLAELTRERPDLQVVERRIDADPAALERLRAVSEKAHVEVPGVPTFVLGERVLVGFNGAVTERRLRELVEGGEATGSDAGGICEAEPGAGSGGAPCEPAPTGDVETSFGVVSLNELGMPLFTLVMGLIDGFNPCAMWVLVFLLSMLVSMHDRKRMAVVAGTFVLASGVVYFLFMAAWLNIFLLVGMSRAVQVVLGVVALVMGAINVKDFFAFKKGVSLSIPESVKPGIYARARNVLRKRALAASLLAVIVLAALVNVVELLCTAGLPAVYTAILTEQGFTSWERYGYLALYNVAYIADDAVMVTIAVVTLNKARLTERGGRWLKLLGGAVMLVLALALIAFPDALF